MDKNKTVCFVSCCCCCTGHCCSWTYTVLQEDRGRYLLPWPLAQRFWVCCISSLNLAVFNFHCIDKVETSLEWQLSLPRYDWCAPCHSHLPVCLWIMDPHSGAPRKYTSHGNEVLPQDTTHLIQRPCYQRGSPCQDPAGNRTTRRGRGRKTTIKEWTGLEFTKSQRAVEIRGKNGRNWLRTHLWCPDDPRG